MLNRREFGIAMSRLEMFRRLGVPIIQLTYNVRNLIGDGCLEPGDAGLSTFGIGSDLSITPIEETPEYLKTERAFAEGRAARKSAAPDEDRPLVLPALNHPRRLEGVAELLAGRGHPVATIEKVIGGNFHRVFRDIWSV